MLSPAALDGPPPARLAAGTRFGDYELVEIIARGGMGIVWRARQKSLNREVAIKVIAAGELASEDFIERFHTEARAAASLDHSNIVPIYEIGEHDGRHFFSMKLIEGRTLTQESGGAPLRPARTAQLVATLARAVHYAHQRGILHRDIKPNNILIDASGQPHLTDFGLAKLIEKESKITRTMAVLGTPSYISPEQAAGKGGEVTTAADVYSLGAVMYELLTGQPPFAGGPTLETVRHVLEKEPRRPSLLNSEIDPDLETICLKCLDKSPERRYGSAEALADDVERWTRREPIVARRASVSERMIKWVRRRPQLAALLAIAAVAPVIVIVTLAVSNYRIRAAQEVVARHAEENRQRVIQLNVATGIRAMSDGDWSAALLWCAEAIRLENGNALREDPHRYRIASLLREMPVLREMWFHQGSVLSLEFNRDGTRIVTASADGTARLWPTDDSSTSRVLTHSGPVESAVFSPDGARVATISVDETARVWDAVSGTPITPPIQLNGGGKQISFDPSGAQLLTPNGKAAQIWSAATGEPVRPPMKHSRPVQCAVFSPDGAVIATGAEDTLVRLWDSKTGRLLREFPSHHLAVRNVWFSPDGERLATVVAYNVARIWDVATGNLIAGPLRLRDHVLEARFSPDGGRLLTASFDTTAQVWQADTLSPAFSPIEHHDVVSTAQWSADGSRILTASWDRTARVWDATTGNPLSPVLRHGARVQAASLSPDGTLIATGDGNGVVRLWQTKTNRATRLVVRHDGPAEDAALSPDGARLLTASLDATARLWDAVTGRELFRWPHAQWVHSAAFRKDGQSAATFSRDRTVRFWDLASGKELPEMERRHLADVPRSTSDGSRLLIVDDDKAVRVWDSASGKTLCRIDHGASMASSEFTPDGAFVLTVGADGSARVWKSDTGEAVGKTIQPAGDQLKFARISPDGSRVVIVSFGQPRPLPGGVGHANAPSAAEIYSVATGKLAATPLHHEGPIHHLSFSPDGRRIATASWDTTARVWDAFTGAPITPPMRHDRLVYYVSFSRDGRRILTASGNLHARVWDAATGDPLTLPLKHDDQVVRARFGPAEREVVTASSDGTVRVFEIAKTEASAEELVGLAKLLSGHCLSPAGALLPLDNLALSNLWRVVRRNGLALTADAAGLKAD